MADSEVESEAKTTVCPCCGKQTMKLPVQVSESFKQHFLSCMISGTPYQRQYMLFEGKVKVIVTQLHPEWQDNLIQLGVKARLADSQAEKTVLNNISQRVFRLLPIRKFCVTDFRNNSQEYNISDIVFALLKEALLAQNIQSLQKIYAKLNDPQVIPCLSMPLIDKLIVTHNRTLDILVESGFDDLFYAGIPHGC